MKKTAILAITAATMLTASIGFTAPLTDYSAGKTSIDLTWRNSDIHGKAPDGDTSLDKKYNLDWGITTGLGNNFAIQYNGYNAKSKDTVEYSNAFETESMNIKLKTQELNVLYKLDKNISVYAGLVRLKATVNQNEEVSGVNTSSSFSSDNKNKLQIGLVGSTKIADKTTAYASVGVASDFTNWKVGLAQEIAPNVEFNVDYRRLKAKKIGIDNVGDADITAKGVGFGVTCKF